MARNPLRNAILELSSTAMNMDSRFTRIVTTMAMKNVNR